MHIYMRTSASHSIDHLSSLPSLLCLHHLLVIFLLHHPFIVPTQVHPSFSISMFFFFFLLLFFTPSSSSKCGNTSVPFPLFLTTPTFSNSFHLSCLNSSILYINISSFSNPLLQFYPDGILLQFPNTSSASAFHQYSDFKSFPFIATPYFSVSTHNIFHLSDCEDSSLCNSPCPKTPPCDDLPCCYPLSDTSAWHPGEALSNFSRFGCRGFLSWLASPGTNTVVHGIKLEWAVPSNSTLPVCAPIADVVNATAVTSEIRSQCRDGFVGDGYALGSGCLKCMSCLDSGKF